MLTVRLADGFQSSHPFGDRPMASDYRPFYEPDDEPVPDYTLVKRLGKGQSGEVWRANGPGVDVAIKTVNLTEQIGQKELRALRRVKDINHPNLMPIYGFWLKAASGRTFADTQLVESTVVAEPGPGEPSGTTGTLLASAHATCDREDAVQLIIAMGLGDCTLGDRLKECRDQDLPGIPRGELLDYMQSAAAAIDLLNTKHQIQHCDIKPTNLLLVGGGVQVCDFGVAKAVARDDLRNTAPGYTPAYAPPELIRAEEPAPTSDQYALAISYVELRTGHLPFPDELAAFYDAKEKGTLDLGGLSSTEQEVIRQATSLDADQRYPTCQSFVSALRQADSRSSDQEHVTDYRQYYQPEDVPAPGYKLDKLLGEGGAGQVWKARGAGVDVALKVVNLNREIGDKELRALKLIQGRNFPNLAAIYGFWLRDGSGHVIDGSHIDFEDSLSLLTEDGERPVQLIIAMGLGEMTLEDRLHECKRQHLDGIPRAELLSHLSASAKAIDFLNRQDIQHCDIKPSNILLVGGEAQVCDYGLAQMAGSDLQETSIAYSAPYAAPEIIRRDKPARTTDQFSLAITYVELLTGTLPYPTTSRSALEMAKIKGNIDLSRLMRRDRKVINRATSLNPRQRYATNVKMVTALEAAESRRIWPIVSVGLAILVLAAMWLFPRYQDSQTLKKIDSLLGDRKYSIAWSRTEDFHDDDKSEQNKYRVLRNWYEQLDQDVGQKLDSHGSALAMDETCDDLLVGRINYAPPEALILRALLNARLGDWEAVDEDLKQTDPGRLEAESVHQARYYLLVALRSLSDSDGSETVECVTLGDEAIEGLQIVTSLWNEPDAEDGGEWIQQQYERLLDALVKQARHVRRTEGRSETFDAITELLQEARWSSEIEFESVREFIVDGSAEKLQQCREDLNSIGRRYLGDESTQQRVRFFHDVLKMADANVSWSAALDACTEHKATYGDLLRQAKYRDFLSSQLQQRLVDEVLSPAARGDNQQLLRQHRDLHLSFFGATDALTDACWIEAVIAPQYDGGAATDDRPTESQWSEFRQWASGISEEPLFPAYLHYVKGLVLLDSDDEQGLQELLSAAKMDDESGWKNSVRRRRMARLLLQGSSRLGVDDATLAYLPTLRDSEIDLYYRYVDAAKGLLISEQDLAAELKADLIGKLALVMYLKSPASGSNESETDYIIRLVAAYEKLRGPSNARLRLVKAHCLARRAKDHADLQSAIKNYAAALSLWDNAHGSAKSRTNARKVCDQALTSAIETAGLNLPTEFERPTKVRITDLQMKRAFEPVRKDLAAIYAFKGRLCSADHGTASKRAAYQAYLAATLLDPANPEYVVRLGLHYYELPDVPPQMQLTELNRIATRAEREIHTPTFELWGLRGYVDTRRSRSSITQAEKMEHLSAAIANFEKALKQEGIPDEDRVRFLIGVSTAKVERAFIRNVHERRLSAARELLISAQDYAQEAAELASSLASPGMREAAWLAKGNAEEDLAHYVSETKWFTDATKSFEQARRAAVEANQSTVPARLSMMRVRYREIAQEIHAADSIARLRRKLEKLEAEMLGLREQTKNEEASVLDVLLAGVYVSQAELTRDDPDKSQKFTAQARKAYERANRFARDSGLENWPVYQEARARFEATHDLQLATALAIEIEQLGTEGARDDAFLGALRIIVRGTQPADPTLEERIAGYIARAKDRQFFQAELRLLRAEAISRLAYENRTNDQGWEALHLWDRHKDVIDELGEVARWATDLDDEPRSHFLGRAEALLGTEWSVAYMRARAENRPSSANEYRDNARIHLDRAMRLLAGDTSTEAENSRDATKTWWKFLFQEDHRES